MKILNATFVCVSSFCLMHYVAAQEIIPIFDQHIASRVIDAEGVVGNVLALPQAEKTCRGITYRYWQIHTKTEPEKNIHVLQYQPAHGQSKWKKMTDEIIVSGASALQLKDCNGSHLILLATSGSGTAGYLQEMYWDVSKRTFASFDEPMPKPFATRSNSVAHGNQLFRWIDGVFQGPGWLRKNGDGIIEGNSYIMRLRADGSVRSDKPPWYKNLATTPVPMGAMLSVSFYETRRDYIVEERLSSDFICAPMGCAPETEAQKNIVSRTTYYRVLKNGRVYQEYKPSASFVRTLHGIK